MLCLHNAWEVFLIILFFFPNLKLMSAFFHEKKKQIMIMTIAIIYIFFILRDI